MIFLEDSARFLLVIHAILGAALVGATTHTAWWLRNGPDPHRPVRRLAAIGAGLFLATFATGNLLHPTYQIRVRGEILDSGDAIAALHRDRIEARHRFRERHYGGPAVPPVVDESAAAVESLPRRTARVGRWFDVKQHWVGLGLIAALVLGLGLASWHSERGDPVVVPVYRFLAIGLAMIAWLAAGIGLIAASYQSVAGFG